MSAAPGAAAAAEIVRLAMADRRVYDAMARRENEVWSSLLGQRERSAARAEDQAAAQVLRLGRNLLRFPAWMRGSGRRFGDCLSVGCGEGRLERQLMATGLCERFLGLDVAEGALADARAAAAAEGLAIEYRTADINFAELAEGTFDLIVAQTSLHHVLHLEHVADQIVRALRPGGVLWIHDYIGESQFQYSDTRLKIVNRLVAGLPPAFRHDRVHERKLGPLVRRAPGTLVSPFESIRSADIPDVFLARFEALERRETTTLLHLLVPVGTRAAFAATEEGRAVFETLFTLDELMARYGVLTPVTGQYILTPRRD